MRRPSICVMVVVLLVQVFAKHSPDVRIYQKYNFYTFLTQEMAVLQPQFQWGTVFPSGRKCSLLVRVVYIFLVTVLGTSYNTRIVVYLVLLQMHVFICFKQFTCCWYQVPVLMYTWYCCRYVNLRLCSTRALPSCKYEHYTRIDSSSRQIFFVHISVHVLYVVYETGVLYFIILVSSQHQPTTGLLCGTSFSYYVAMVSTDSLVGYAQDPAVCLSNNICGDVLILNSAVEHYHIVRHLRRKIKF